MNKCFLCSRDIPVVDTFRYVGRPFPIKCTVCGSYKISEQVARQIGIPGSAWRPAWSWATRANSELGTPLIINRLEDLENSIVPAKGLLDCIDRFLMYLEHKHEEQDPNTHVTINPEFDFPLAYCRNPDHFVFVLSKAHSLGYIEKGELVTHFIPSQNGGAVTETRLDQYRLDLAGWRRIQEISPVRRTPTQAFVAMSFSSEMRTLFTEAIKPALEQCGYHAIRIDGVDFNDEIIDRVVAEIRKSRLVIADLTEHKNGVYFEAGFSMGLGIPVIWTCRNDGMEGRHFDVTHFNCIAWESHDDLRRRLISRIEATLPVPGNL